MKQIKKPKQTSLLEDMTLAVKRFFRDEFGFQQNTVHKNKKKYDRKRLKKEMKREYENIPFNFNKLFLTRYNICI